jgi:hypothetical protein
MFPVFAAMRILVGGMSYAAPRLSARLFRFDPAGNPQSSYWARLFGVRDVALGVGALQASGEARRRIVLLTAACDAADVVTTIAERRAGRVARGSALLSAALAITAGVVAVAAADADG